MTDSPDAARDLPGTPVLPVRPELAGEAPYGAPQLDVPVLLNVNENPYPPSDAVVREIAEAVAEAAHGLNRYPDREFLDLRADLADYLAVESGVRLPAEQIWAANGSNEVMLHLLQGFGGPGRTAVSFAPTYSMYPEYARDTHTRWVAGRRTEDFDVDPAEARALLGQLHLVHPGPPGLGGQLVPVLLRPQPDRGRLDPHRQVLGHHRHVLALLRQIGGDGEDPGVVVTQAETGGERVRVGVVQLHPEHPALVTDRDRRVQPAVREPQLVQHPQGRPGEEPEFGVMALAFQLGDHHQRQHHVVFGEAGDRPRVGKQDRRVDDVGPSARSADHG